VSVHPHPQPAAHT